MKRVGPLNFNAITLRQGRRPRGFLGVEFHVYVAFLRPKVMVGCRGVFRALASFALSSGFWVECWRVAIRCYL